MYRISKPSCTSVAKTCTRAFHASPASSGISPLFALQALANSRETQHFSKVSRLSRVEHSPNLEIIRSSEVDPFQRRAPPPPDTRQPLSVAEQQEKVKNDASPKLIPSALSRGSQLESSLDRHRRGRGTGGSPGPAPSFGLDPQYAAELRDLRAHVSVLETKAEDARLSYRGERKILQSRIDALEGREGLYANLVIAGVFVGAIWYWRPQLEELFTKRNREGRVWDREQMRERIEGRWRAATGGPAPVAVVKRSFDARDDPVYGAAPTTEAANDAMTVPKTILRKVKQEEGIVQPHSSDGGTLSRLFWK